MERRIRKAINFDLDTEQMRAMFLYPNGYGLLKKSFEKHDFTHRQGSGYISNAKLDSDQVNDIMAAVVKEQPWLTECVKKIDVTDIGKQHDLTAVVKSLAAQQSEQLDQRSGNLSEKQNGAGVQSKKSLTEEERIARAMEVSAKKIDEEYGEYVARQNEQVRQEPQSGQVRPTERQQEQRGAAGKQKKPNPGKGRGK